MKKRIVSLVLAVVMVAALFAGCGNNGAGTSEPTAAPASESQPTEAPAVPATEAPSTGNPAAGQPGEAGEESPERPAEPATEADLAAALNAALGTVLEGSGNPVTWAQAVVLTAKALELPSLTFEDGVSIPADSVDAADLEYAYRMANLGYTKHLFRDWDEEMAQTDVQSLVDAVTGGGDAVTVAPAGTYVGWKNAETGTVSYRNILFATNERYQRAVMVPDSDETKFAILDGPSSNAGDPGALNLTIYVNPNSDSDSKSVFMWQYGSAQLGGNPSRSNWSRFVEENPDIIVVTSSHRGGFWGSIDLSSLEGYDSERYWGSNNLARLDLLECLKWINHNISAFGGNPNDVTIGGQSSGSNNVTCLLMMEEAHPYYQKAIMESSFSIDISLQLLEDAQFVSQKFFELLGVSSIDELMAKTDEELNAAQSELTSASVSGSSSFSNIEAKTFSPVVDGEVIPFDYYDKLLNGSLSGIQCVFGSNEGEYDQQYFNGTERLSDADALAFTVAQNWGKLDSERGWNKDNAQAVIDEFFSHNAEYGRNDFDAARDLKNDLYLRLGSVMYAEAASRYTDVYMYYGAVDTTPEDSPLADGRRTAHGSEIPIISHNWASFEVEGGLFEVDPASQSAAQMMTDIWAAFIRTGNPNCQALADKGVTWTKYNAKTRDTLIMGKEPRMSEGIRNKDTDLLLPLFREYEALNEAKTAKISAPGKYQNYSEPVYDGYNRYSLYVPVSDGTKIAVDYCIPTKDGVEETEPLPVIFTWTPYGRVSRTVSDAEWFTQYGYILASGDVRGMGASYGTRDSANSPQEAQDGADIVAWLKAQPFCNGKLGTIGSSYVGQTQLAILSKSKLVDAAVIGCTDYNKYDGWIRGGIPRAFGSYPDTRWGDTPEEVAATIAGLVERGEPVDGDTDRTMLAEAIAQHVDNGLQIPMFQRLLWRDSYSEEVDGEYWNMVSASTNKKAINTTGTAIYLLGGLYDVFRRDTFVMFQNLATPKKLTIGPWYHTKAKLDPDWTVEQLRWFDYWLKDMENGIMDEAPIYLKTANQTEDNGYSWHKDWPVDAGTRTNLYLNADNSLAAEQDAAERFIDYDVVYGIQTGVEDTSSADVDAKGVAFTTEPLAEDFKITGHAIAHISFELLTEADDIDFFVTVSDVDPETGDGFIFDDGHLRASLRGTATPTYDFLGLPWHPDNTADADPIAPGQVYTLDIDLMPTSYIVPAGHCLRVTLSNSMDRFYYLGRYEYEADPDCETPDVRIYTGGGNASYVEFPDIYAK